MAVLPGGGEGTVHAEPSFAATLKGARRAAHLTQESLAERSGVSGRTISDLERGIAAPRLATKASGPGGLAELIGDRSLLLVLDNFEQLVEAAPLLSRVLSRCLRLKILVTSRIPLRIRGEHEVPVPPLGVPGAGASLAEIAASPAVRMFAACARERRAAWRFWYGRGHLREGYELLVRALGDAVPGDLSPADARVWTRALSSAASLHYVLGGRGEVRDRYAQALGLWRRAGDSEGLAATLGNLGMYEHYSGDRALARGVYGEAIAAARAVGNERITATILQNLGTLLL